MISSTRSLLGQSISLEISKSVDGYSLGYSTSAILEALHVTRNEQPIRMKKIAVMSLRTEFFNPAVRYHNNKPLVHLQKTVHWGTTVYQNDNKVIDGRNFDLDLFRAFHPDCARILPD